jgi:hypothetical protein
VKGIRGAEYLYKEIEVIWALRRAFGEHSRVAFTKGQAFWLYGDLQVVTAQKLRFA